MTRKQKRGVLIGGGVATLGLALVLVLFALKDSIVFFHIPSGILEKGSVVRGQGTMVTFKVTDTLKDIPVTFTGVLPDLFREGQGVVAEGVLDGRGNFKADSVLAKHDQNYMPPNVAKALEAKGVKLGDSAHPGALKAETP